jgi:hypothetical protein
MLFGIVTRRHFFGNGAYHVQMIELNKCNETIEKKRKEKKGKGKERKENIGLYFAGVKFELF